MKTCITCENHEATAGICCPECAAIHNVMTIIKRHWEPGELSKLRDTLRDESPKEAYEAAKARKASVMAKLLWHVIELAHPLKMHPNVFRSKVCGAINEEISAAESIRKYDEKNGENAWMQGVSKALDSWVGQITINKA